MQILSLSGSLPLTKGCQLYHLSAQSDTQGSDERRNTKTQKLAVMLCKLKIREGPRAKYEGELGD